MSRHGRPPLAIHIAATKTAIPTTPAAMRWFRRLLGSVVIYLFGVPWLHASPTFQEFLGHPPSLHETLEAGLYPFVVGDLLKLLAAACALPLAWRLLGRHQGA
jgi:biotin transport system substrate-specific component